MVIEEIVSSMIDLSVKTSELIKALYEKSDTLLKEKPVMLMKELTDATHLLSIYLEIYSDNEFRLDDDDKKPDYTSYEDHEQ
jgi:hypothetical protein